MNNIGVLVVTHNQYKTTCEFLDKYTSLFDMRSPKLLILDNNSSDGTYAKLHLKYPHIDIRRLNANYGCVTGRNIGIVILMRLGYEYIMTLDNDVEIRDKHFFDKMHNFMINNKKVDGCCPIVRWVDNSSIQTLGRRVNMIGIGRNVTSILPDNHVDILPGGATFMRAESYVRFGLYDNDLSPVGVEDYEWGLRATGNGAHLRFNPEAEVFHCRDRTYTPREYVSYGIVGRMVFLRKNFSIINLARELKFITKVTLQYGASFVIKQCLAGITKRIHGNNFDYARFSQQNMRIFFNDTQNNTT